MQPYLRKVSSPIVFLDNRVSLYIGDCIAVMESMEPESVDCVVTSPPYWGLRDYGVDGQHGLEETLAEHLAKMVEVFEAVKRILKPTGTLWVNYGDCYATSPNGRSAADTKAAGNDDRTFRDKPFSTVGPIYDPDRNQVPQTKGHEGSASIKGRILSGGYMKPKDLCMVPNRFAIAMQDAGWWVRSEIVWAKPNPMPESIKDRPATSHEKIFLFTKSAKYFYDNEAVLQPTSKSTNARLSQDVMNQIGSDRANGGKKTNGNMKAVARKHKNLDRVKPHSMHTARVKDNDSFDSALALVVNERNLRNYEPEPAEVEVWNMSTAAFSDAHFATFPPELAKRCILAGCPKDGVVFDPYGGAGTTSLVAARYGYKSIFSELNPEYAKLAQKRIETEWKIPQIAEGQNFGPLFEPAPEVQEVLL
jgi:DNA modification methylase